MATTPEEEFEGRTHVGEQARQIVETARITVAGKRDASAFLVLLLVVAGVSLTLAPQPWSALGVGVLMWVSWRLGQLRV